MLCRTRPIRLEKRAGHTQLTIELPGASKDELEMGVRGGELFVRVRDAERRIALPASVAGLPVRSARLEEGRLTVTFGS